MESQNALVIDGREVAFSSGETILDVARRNGIDIPTLCHMKGATPTGACRICLVEVDGARSLLAACATPAASKMVVRTESPRVLQARRLNLELLLSSGRHNCLAQDLDMDSWTDFQLRAMETKGHEDRCPVYGECRLQDLAIRYQIRGNRFAPNVPNHLVEDVNPFIVRDLSRCVLCGRCVQACNEIQVNNAISYGYRGKGSKIVARGDRPLKDSDCVFCGECVQACPVGALVAKNDFDPGSAGKGEKRLVRTTCAYCGVGCQLYLHVRNDRVAGVTGVEEAGPNHGSLCAKGRFGYEFIHHEGRLKTPLIREGGKLRDASWEEALQFVAEKLAKIRKSSGPDSIGVLTSARMTNEENYVAQKFARAAIGTNNVDHCARL